MKPMPFAALALVLTMWGVFAVHQRSLATRSGYAVQRLERRRLGLLVETRKLECDIASLTRPERIAGEARRLGLNQARSEPGGAPQGRR